MEVARDLRQVGDGANQVVGNVHWLDGTHADPANPVDLVQRAQHVGEIPPTAQILAVRTQLHTGDHHLPESTLREALYLRDPDGNGVELYWDRPEAEWPRTPSGDLAMVTRPLDVEALLAEAG